MNSRKAHSTLVPVRGATNSHSGNRAFRSLVKQYQDKYLQAKKRDKPAVASIVVEKIREKGGRFLRRVDATPQGQVLYIDIGDDRAREVGFEIEIFFLCNPVFPSGRWCRCPVLRRNTIRWMLVRKPRKRSAVWFP